MEKFAFKELHYGPRWHILKEGLPRRSAGFAYALEWFREHDYEVIDVEYDNENDAIDVMAAKHGNLYQFAIERE